MTDYDEVEPTHRHVSHLYGLHPSDLITVDGTPELAKAAKAGGRYLAPQFDFKPSGKSGIM